MHGKQSFVIIALIGIMGKRKTEGGAGEERRGAECGKKRTEKQKNIKIKRTTYKKHLTGEGVREYYMHG